jgi:hypothetical protein
VTLVPAALAEALADEAWRAAALDAERACAGAPSVDLVATLVARRATGIVIDELERYVETTPDDVRPGAEAAYDALVEAFRGLTVALDDETAAAQLGLPPGGGARLDTAALRDALAQVLAVCPGDWAAYEPVLGSLACAGAALAAAGQLR